jgi:hypothetical protein
MDFKSYIENRFTYVDKTGMIGELINNRDIFLITRPRRFGKSLNLNMLECFFSNKSNEGEIEKIFGNLNIWRNNKAHDHAGKYPVVSLSFKSLRGDTWIKLLEQIRDMMSEVYAKHLEPVRDSIKGVRYKRIIDQIIDIDLKPTVTTLSRSLKTLTYCLEMAYGKRTILLIDEYDSPFIHAQNNGYFDKAADFMKIFLGEALKDNLSLEFSVVTGIVQIARESIFSELNNLVVCDVFSSDFAGDFGFTEPEVMELARIYSKVDEIDSIRSWYNGYEYNKVEIYNPWSVMNYFRYGEFRPYWVNTSENTLIQDLLRSSPSDVISEMLHLLAGGHLKKSISTRITFRNLRLGEDNIFSLMVTAGYLKAVPIQGEGHQCMVTLPNQEMPECFHVMFKNLLIESKMGRRISDIVASMLSANEKKFEAQLNDYMLEVMSTFDSLESFYHGFMVSLAGYAYETHQIRSNREAGTGRYDLSMFPKKPDGIGVLMEFKKLDKDEKVEELLSYGLGQVDERQYALDFKLQGIKCIVYTMVFDGKVCHLRLRN